METKLAEIAPRVYRMSTCIPDVAPGGFTFNQYLVDADEPLLFHCGMRGLFGLVSAAVARVIPLERLRWISFGHVEADECGALNQWLAAAPHARVLHSKLACGVSVNDLADRPPLPLDDGAEVDLGGRRVRLLMTPHVPHNWESIVLWESVTRTLLCGDVLTTVGDGPALAPDEPVERVLAGERSFGAWSHAPETGAVLRRLAALEPATLAAMHGSAYAGDCRRVLLGLADGLPQLARARAAPAPAATTVGPAGPETGRA